MRLVPVYCLHQQNSFVKFLLAVPSCFEEPLGLQSSYVGGVTLLVQEAQNKSRRVECVEYNVALVKITFYNLW